MLVRPNLEPGNAGRLMSETEVIMSPERADSQAISSSGKPGAILANERKAQGLSIEQVADQLKLAPRQIVALENDDYAALPGMAIVRGFVRAYAKYLRLDAAPLVAMIAVDNGLVAEAMPMRREMATPFAETRMPSMSRRNMTPIWVIGSGIVLCLILVLAWLQLSGSKLPVTLGAAKSEILAASASASAVIASAGVAADSASAALNTAGNSVGSPSTANVSVSLPNPLNGDGRAAEPAAHTVSGSSTPVLGANPQVNPITPTATPAIASNTLPANNQVANGAANAMNVTPANNVLVLKLRQDSWVEVKRSNGTVLVSRVLKAGSSETIEMSAPVQLVVGNVNGVEAQLRGAPLSLKNGAGNTARVNLK